STLGACGQCDACDTGRPTHCRVQGQRIRRPFTWGERKAFQFANAGVFAETTVVNAIQAVKIDDDVPFDVASLIGCGEKDQTEEAAPPATEETTEGADGLMDQLGDTADDLKDAAADQLQTAIAAFQKTSQEQVDNLTSQVTTMKQAAVAAADDQLNGLLAQLDTKLGAAGDLLGQLAGADEATLQSSKSQFNELISEVQGLLADAKSRMQELNLTIPGG
ncbi:MAG: hypothetical protein ACF8NJ_01060, partial [Phycisphaerales bacterium JB038]